MGNVVAENQVLKGREVSSINCATGAASLTLMRRQLRDNERLIQQSFLETKRLYLRTVEKQGYKRTESHTGADYQVNENAS